MFAHDRRKHILDVVTTRGRLTLGELRDELGVSSATLRRDLTVLEGLDKVVRTHGGVLHPSILNGEPTLDEKRVAKVAEKRALAEALVADVPDGSVVLLDSGSTCYEVARRLKHRAGLTVVTNSIPVLADYRDWTARLVAMGGEVRAVSGALVGDVALGWLESLRADLAILGASGLDACDGASTTEAGELAVKRGLLARAKVSWLAVDSSKCERSAGFGFGNWSNFERVYTDAGFPKRFASGVRVVRSGSDSRKGARTQREGKN